MDSTTTPRPPRTPQAHYTCPHCGGELALSAPALPPTATDPSISPGTALMSPTAPALGPLAQVVGRWLDRLFPITRALRWPQPALVAPVPATGARARWGRWAPLLLSIAVILLWLILRAVTGNSSTSAAPAPVASIPTIGAVRASPAVFSPEQAALLAVVAQYNAADQQVAVMLALDPIRPFLDERGPLLARRVQELTRRKQTNATHTTRLLRWAVGAITIDAAGTTATLVTQETWENQEAGAVAPSIATARVTYTLRRANTQMPWRIYNVTSTMLGS
jgi:hypothetical protein